MAMPQVPIHGCLTWSGVMWVWLVPLAPAKVIPGQKFRGKVTVVLEPWGYINKGKSRVKLYCNCPSCIAGSNVWVVL